MRRPTAIARGCSNFLARPNPADLSAEHRMQTPLDLLARERRL